MNKIFFSTIFLFLLYPVLAFCQAPDSLIFDTVYVEYDTTQSHIVYLDVYMVTSDTADLEVFTIVANWPPDDSTIHVCGGFFVADFFYEWDEIWDTLMIDEGIYLLIAWCDTGGDPNPCYIYTDSLRLNVVDLRVCIGRYAQPQWYEIGDYLAYPPNYVVIPGGIMYGNPTVINGDELQTPKDYFLYQNYPNPFNTQTIIKFACLKIIM